MIAKEYWDTGKDNGIFWLGGNISILAHKAGFLKLEKIGEFYGEGLEKASQILAVPLEDLKCIKRRIEDENKGQKSTS